MIRRHTIVLLTMELCLITSNNNTVLSFPERVSPSNSSNEIRFGGHYPPQNPRKMSREGPTGSQNQQQPLPPPASVSVSEKRMAKYKEERRRQLASQIANRLSTNHGSSSSDENEDSNASSLEKYAKYRRHHR